MKLKQRYSLKQQLRHSISDAAQIFGIASGGVSIPVPENRPPTFVFTWDGKQRRPKLTRGGEYYEQNKRRIERGWGRK